MEHLHPKAAEFLELTDEERIAQIKIPKTIIYPVAGAILTRFESLFTHPRMARMPSLLLCGDSNAGKSVLISHFADKKNSAAPDEPTLPVLVVQAPPTPNEREFYSVCLQAVDAPFRATDPPTKLRVQLTNILRDLHTRIIFIDEVHNFAAGSTARQRAFLNMLKFLSNDLKLPLVAAGTRDALVSFQQDAQMSNRFEPVMLPRWGDGGDFRRLLASFEKTIPLRNPSYLSSDAVAARLLVMSEGLLGELVTILVRASEGAIRSGRECIDIASLDDLKWVYPSERRSNAVEMLAKSAHVPNSDASRSGAEKAPTAQSSSSA